MKPNSRYLSAPVLRLAFILVFFWVCDVTAQQDASQMFKRYSTKDGLLNNGIYSLCRSKNGMWWIGTGNGLQRFDGYTFEIWNDIEDSVKAYTPSVQNVYEDRRGNVWLINYSEHYVIPAGSKKLKRVHYDFPDSLAVPDYLPIVTFEDSSRLWCYQSNEGFYGFNKGTLKVDTFLQVKFKRNINRTVVTLPTASTFNNNGAWVCLDFGDSSYVVRFLPGKELFTKSFASKDIGRIKGVIPINEVEVLLISTRYTALYNDELKKPIKILSTDNIPGNFIRGLPHVRLKVGKMGSILFAGDKGIYEYVPSTQVLKPYSTSFYPEINLSRQLMFALKEDEAGNLWIGRDGSDGLLVYFPGKLRFEFLRAPREHFNLVYSLAVTDDGSIISGNFQKGLNVFDSKGVWKKHLQVPGLENDLSPSIRTINRFNPDYLVLKSLFDKLLLLNVKNYSFVDLSTLVPAQIRAYVNIFDTNIYPVKDNEVHFTHGKYVVRVTHEEDKFDVTIIDSLAHENPITSITYSKEGKRILGTIKGIYLKDKFWKLVPGTENFQVKHITSDNQGVIWAAGPQGICTIKNDKVLKVYNEANGLLNQFIYGILFDDEGNAWYSSNRGIGCVHQDGSISFFTEADGLQGDEFDTQSFWKGSDSKLYFGGINGITAFYPNEVLQTSNVGNVVLSAVNVNGRNYPEHGRVDDLKEMQLPYNQNSLQFNFSFTNFSDPDYNVYQIFMEGHDKQWLNLKNANSARYLLAPGVYSLHLKGSSDGNNWSKEIVIPIVINPAWWQTGLFRWATVIALLSVFGFGAWYFNKIKTSKLKHQLHVEQEMQKERERISRDLHDHIGAYSTALIANADSLDQRVEDEKLRATVLRLKENSRYVLSALRETIWVLNTKNLTVTGFYEGFINYSTNILRNHEGIEIEFKDEIFRNAQLHPAIAIQLLRILQEVVQNTIKHARASKVSCIFCCNRKIMITISDNGQGYAAEAIQLGNGLRNIEQRAKEIGFQLETTSIVGEGTKVTICGDV